ncbi:MAG: C39 family peptidase [Candidatus Magasanikbacteria bacterium]|nr:C39 family peptidase [Candidatus Magasanikbacteria bacterium]
MLKARLLAFLILILGLLAGWGFWNRVDIKQSVLAWQNKRSLPTALNQEQLSQLPISQIESLTKKTIGKLSVNTLPEEINIAVPFTSQAPFAIWDPLHDEACEEASLIMLDAFYKGKKSLNKEQAELLIQNLVQWEKEKYGYFEDTTSEQGVEMLEQFFKLNKAKVVYDITIDDIKKALAQGRPVVVPAAGKLLKNPYFRGGGPLYHMLVIKGYTKDGRFITNDPGTRRGEDFTYNMDALYNAIHDWREDGDILKGRKAMIIIE